jgi:hypothetical protein
MMIVSPRFQHRDRFWIIFAIFVLVGLFRWYTPSAPGAVIQTCALKFTQGQSGLGSNITSSDIDINSTSPIVGDKQNITRTLVIAKLSEEDSWWVEKRITEDVHLSRAVYTQSIPTRH